MNRADAFDMKHDTASVYSMDSAYQSQSGASRRGVSMPEGYQSLTPQDTRSRVSSQLLGSDIYSPTLSADNFATFPEQHSEMGHMQLPSGAGEMDSGENTFAYANYTTGQDYSQYTATSIPRFAPATGMDMGFQWSTADPQAFTTPFNYTSLYSSQEQPELMFNQPAPPQQQLSRPSVDTSHRPTAARSSSSFSQVQYETRRPSANESNFGAFVMSPTSAISAQPQSGAPSDFELQQIFEAR